MCLEGKKTLVPRPMHFTGAKIVQNLLVNIYMLMMPPKIVFNIPVMTADEMEEFKRKYEKEKFPGLEIPMDQVT